MSLCEVILNFLSSFVNVVALCGWMIIVIVLGFVAYSIYRISSIEFDDEDEL